jgi:integrase
MTGLSRVQTRARKAPDPDLGATSPIIAAVLDDYRISLEASNRSRATRETIYLPAVEMLDRFLVDTGMPRRVGAIRREHVEAFLVDLRGRAGRKGQTMSPATVSKIYRALRPFFGWLIEENEIEADPMARIPRPRVPETHKTPISAEDVAKMHATCDPKTFEGRRDLAILFLLGDTGMRRGELVGLRVEDVNLRERLVAIQAETSKGRRWRAAGIGKKAADAMARYLRLRASHKLADRPELWLGSRNRGPLTGGAVLLMIRRRASQAGLSGLHPHLWRHTFAHEWLRAGGSEGDLMEVAGWRDRAMPAHYAGALRSERAVEAARRLSPMDKLYGIAER